MMFWQTLLITKLLQKGSSYTLGSNLKSVAGFGSRNNGENIMKTDVILEPRPSYFPDVDYGGVHPFDKYKSQHGRETENLDRKLNQIVEENFKPIRIVFDTSMVELVVPTGDGDRRIKIESLIQNILPEVVKIWSSAISLVPVVGNLKIGADVDQARIEGRFTNCPISNRNPDGSITPHEHSITGIENADTVVYIRIDDINCSSNIVPALPNGIPCELDQYDRPIAGTLDFCIERLNLNRFNVVLDEDVTTAINSIVHEVGHILGMNSELFKFFRRRDGEPLTPRPFVPTPIQCVNGNTMIMYKPSCNTIQRRVVDGFTAHFEVVTPTVLQVVKNHFNCQSLTGARLENQPGQPNNCFGTNWDQRLHLMESMASSTQATEFILSPLTLALLEDSGWYRSNYTSPFVKVNPFGHIAGCDFVTKSCLADGGLTVPNYSKGYFCNSQLSYTKLSTLDGKLTCDSSHGSKAWCDLVDYSDVYWRNFDNGPPKRFQHFTLEKLGSFNVRTDYCPTALEHYSIKCDDADRKPLFTAPYEVYGEGSRCFNKLESFDDSICLASRCNDEIRKLEVFLGNESIVCDDGETHSVIDGEFECPKLAAVCPQYFCPKNCAGRGLCNMNFYGGPKCMCFNESDETEGCYHSDPKEPISDAKTCGDLASGTFSSYRCLHSILISSFVFATFIFLFL